MVIIQSKADSLDDKPSDLEELKLVLRTISNIRDISVDVETNIRDVIERYRLLAMYSLLVSWRCPCVVNFKSSLNVFCVNRIAIKIGAVLH